jgi:hypothetical protein
MLNECGERAKRREKLMMMSDNEALRKKNDSEKSLLQQG